MTHLLRPLVLLALALAALAGADRVPLVLDGTGRASPVTASDVLASPAPIRSIGTAPRLELVETDAAVDDRRWWLAPEAGSLVVRQYADGLGSSVAPLTLTPSGGATVASGLTVSAGTTAVQALTATGATVGTNAAAGTLTVNGQATGQPGFDFQIAGSSRWKWRVDSGAETGSDAGSGIQLQARTDAGGFIDNVLSITRASGGLIQWSTTRTSAFGPITAGTGTFTGGVTVGTGGGSGLTVTTGGLTVSAGTTAVQALTATSGAFSGDVTFSGGAGAVTLAAGSVIDGPGNDAPFLRARNAADSSYVDLLYMDTTDRAVIPRALRATGLVTLEVGLTVSSGTVTIASSTASTSTTTGALVVTGGGAFGAASTFGGDITITKSSPALYLIGTEGSARTARIYESAGTLYFRDESFGTLMSVAMNSGSVTVVGGITHGSSTLLTTTAALNNGAASATGTLTNAPAAGNPTKWIPINDNGTTRYIPAW